MIYYGIKDGGEDYVDFYSNIKRSMNVSFYLHLVMLNIFLFMFVCRCPSQFF